VFFLTRRGKKTIAFIGVMLLCFLTTLLIDSRLHLTAAFTGVLAVVALIAFVIASFKQRTEKRKRGLQERTEVARRAAAAAARSERRAAAAAARGERINKTKATVTHAAKAASKGASGIVGAARTGFTGARERFWSRGKASEPNDSGTSI
jgi:predicted lipid-binding transport protein (Tim44 family)